MNYNFKVHKEKKGYWAQCIELPGCITEANSLKALQKNMEKALNLYIQEPEESKDLAPLPDPSIRQSASIMAVAVEPQFAFAFLVRYYRIKHGFTQEQTAKKMGFPNLYSYQRLENKRCNPSLKTMAKPKASSPTFP